jgi:hypothetical protein
VQHDGLPGVLPVNIGASLGKKLGPLPTWAWLGLVGVGAWYFLLRGKVGTPNAAASGSALNSGYSLGFAQGQQAAAPGAPGPAPGGPASSPVNASDWKRAGSGWLYAPNGVEGTFVLAGQQYYHLTDPGAANAYSQAGGVTYFFPAPGLPAPYPWGTPTGATPGTAIYGVRPAVGVGGARIGGPAAIGSRSANLWHHAHPLVGARVPYSYHVRAVGGAPNHAREVHRVATQAGVHPARIMMLNPDPHYPGRQGDHIRVA